MPTDTTRRPIRLGRASDSETAPGYWLNEDGSIIEECWGHLRFITVADLRAECERLITLYREQIAECGDPDGSCAHRIQQAQRMLTRLVAVQ